VRASFVFMVFPLLLLACGDPEESVDPLSVDNDGDGYSELEGDCDDTDPESTLVSEDADCDGVVFSADCDDEDGDVQRECLQLSAGPGAACLLQGPGRVYCWDNGTGDASLEPLLNEVPSDQLFTSVTVGNTHACALTAQGQAVCWGNNDVGQAEDQLEGSVFTSLSAGTLNTCGLTSEGAIECWGDGFVSTGPPSGGFERIDLGPMSACGVRQDGSLACWGSDTSGQADPPSGIFRSVNASHNAHSCGVKTDGILACWGGYADLGGPEELSEAPDGSFQSVVVGAWHNCALGADGTIACWEESKYDIHVPPPSGSYRSLVAGNYFSCAISTTDEVECWGDEEWGIPSPPQEP
jgi:hypothetical protein